MSTRILLSVVLALTALPLQTIAPRGEARCVRHVESMEYPRLALFAQIQGEVKVVIEIDSEGRIRSATATSGRDLLRRAAEENIKRWQFQPGVDEVLNVTYEFKLENPPIQTPRTECKFDLPDTVTVVSNRQAVNN